MTTTIQFNTIQIYTILHNVYRTVLLLCGKKPNIFVMRRDGRNSKAGAGGIKSKATQWYTPLSFLFEIFLGHPKPISILLLRSFHWWISSHNLDPQKLETVLKLHVKESNRAINLIGFNTYVLVRPSTLYTFDNYRQRF